VARALPAGSGRRSRCVGDQLLALPMAPNSRLWSRTDIRLAGHGAAIDAHVAAGRCPPDGSPVVV
jgi:hypothetical protein